MQSHETVYVLAYKAWTVAFDAWRQVKNEKPDASEPDWKEFHEMRVRTAVATLEKATRVLDAIKRFSPMVCGN
jgi:hypothetical protein